MTQTRSDAGQEAGRSYSGSRYTERPWSFLLVFGQLYFECHEHKITIWHASELVCEGRNEQLAGAYGDVAVWLRNKPDLVRTPRSAFDNMVERAVAGIHDQVEHEAELAHPDGIRRCPCGGLCAPGYCWSDPPDE